MLRPKFENVAPKVYSTTWNDKTTTWNDKTTTWNENFTSRNKPVEKTVAFFEDSRR